MKLAFEEHGDGKLAVLLHAFSPTRKMRLPQVETLKSKNYCFILPDLRGFGASHSLSDLNSIQFNRALESFLSAVEI